MFVVCECCVLSGRGLCDEVITRPEESYRVWCVVVCDLETSRIRRPWPTGWLLRQKQTNKQTMDWLYNKRRHRKWYSVVIYEGESIIIHTVCFIFRKTRAVDQTGESEGVRSRLYRGCSNISKFSFLRFSTVWAVSASVVDVDWRPVPSPCLTL